MCHFDGTDSCRLVDDITDDLCECTGFSPTAS